jgi:hypothetical protein
LLHLSRCPRSYSCTITMHRSVNFAVAYVQTRARGVSYLPSTYVDRSMSGCPSKIYIVLLHTSPASYEQHAKDDPPETWTEPQEKLWHVQRRDPRCTYPQILVTVEIMAISLQRQLQTGCSIITLSPIQVYRYMRQLIYQDCEMIAVKLHDFSS